MAEADTEKETLEALDFDTPCAWIDTHDTEAACGRAAEWVMRCSKCGTAGQCCDHHKAQAMGQRVRHTKCGTAGPGSAVFTAERL